MATITHTKPAALASARTVKSTRGLHVGDVWTSTHGFKQAWTGSGLVRPRTQEHVDGEQDEVSDLVFPIKVTHVTEPRKETHAEFLARVTAKPSQAKAKAGRKPRKTAKPSTEANLRQAIADRDEVIAGLLAAVKAAEALVG
jgi:hypothetical protein